MLTRQQVAKELKVSIRTVDTFVKKGLLQRIMLGSLVRFSKEEIDRIKREGFKDG